MAKWWQKQEKGSKSLLKLTLFFVKFLPSFILKIIIFIVSFFYYISSKNERENIKKYLNLVENHFQIKTKSAFWNFYYFAYSICDKFAIWSGKIDNSRFNIINLNDINQKLQNNTKGHILITSHFGNIELARALCSMVCDINIVILVYSKNAAKFMGLIKEISTDKFEIFEINDMSIADILKLKDFVDRGWHIGVMGDRVAINDSKTGQGSFLGQSAKFPLGAIFLASILQTKLSTFWCMKNGDNFDISYELLADNVNLGRDKIKDANDYLKPYIASLENMSRKHPHQWFNFFDFWEK